MISLWGTFMQNNKYCICIYNFSIKCNQFFSKNYIRNFQGHYIVFPFLFFFFFFVKGKDRMTCLTLTAEWNHPPVIFETLHYHFLKACSLNRLSIGGKGHSTIMVKAFLSFEQLLEVSLLLHSYRVHVVTFGWLFL